MAYEIIEASRNTWLKKMYQLQANQLSPEEKVFVERGKTYKIASVEDSDARTPKAGYFHITLSHGAGDWFIFAEHWFMPWQSQRIESASTLPEWNTIDWTEWSAPVSEYFTVGEVTLKQPERIPTDPRVQKNIVAIARRLDDIRRWWGSGLAVNSWYRPPHVNRRIGSRARNHPNGWAVDFRPLKGTVAELQTRFDREWYQPGKWHGGFGLGARRGFIHLDLDRRRRWNY